MQHDNTPKYKSITEKFIFVPSLDEIGSDLTRHCGLTTEELMVKALETPGCIGFNTLGYLKSNINKLEPSRYFSDKDGIYVMRKDVVEEQKRVLSQQSSMSFILQNLDINNLSIDNLSENIVLRNLDIKNPSENTTATCSTRCEDVTEDEVEEVKSTEIHTIQKIAAKDNLIMNDVFIETGSFIGEGIQAALNLGFKHIHSIELSEKYYNICKKRFAQHPNVTIHLGDSGVILKNLIKDIDEGITFWLDGHYSSADTACAQDYCSPIQQELETIRQYSHPDHVIMIDDMKDFTKESIIFNYTQNGKCGYVEKFQLEKILASIYPSPNTYYYGPACVCYSKNKM